MEELKLDNRTDQLSIPESTVTRGTSKNMVTKCRLGDKDASILVIRTFPHELALKLNLFNKIMLISSSTALLSPIITIYKYQLRKGQGSNQLIGLITEWCDTSLGDLLYREEDDLLHLAYKIKLELLSSQHGLSRRLSLLLDFVRGMEMLHEKDIVHGDIYSANLWIREDLSGAVAGFTVSQICEPNGTVPMPTADVLDTIRYPTPEMTAEGKGYYDPFRADVYGIGILIIETLSLKMAWGGKKNDIPAMNQNASELPPELETEDVFKEPQLKDLVNITKRCLSLDPDRRPTLKEIKDSISLSMS